MELEPASTEFELTEDGRVKLPPTLPVQLVAIADVKLAAAAGLEKQLDAFYVGLLKMERETVSKEGEGGLAGQREAIYYRTNNVRLVIAIQERAPSHEDYRPLGIVIPSLSDLIQRLDEAKRSFVRQRSLWAGADSLLLIDPAGNQVEVSETGPMF
jgi:hypothetical protein